MDLEIIIVWGCRGWGWQAAGTWVSVYRAALAQKQRVKHSQNTFGFQSSNLILADGPDLPFQASEGLQGGHHGVSPWPPHKRL